MTDIQQPGRLQITYNGIPVLDETDALSVDFEHTASGEVMLHAKFPAVGVKQQRPTLRIVKAEETE